MVQQPWEYVVDVEDMALRGADRVFERLEGDGAEVKGEALECCIWGLRFRDSGTCAGGVGVFGGPFAVGNLEEGRSGC